MAHILLDQNCFIHNLDYFSSLCSKEKLAIALKDNAYGHGIFEVAKMCKSYGIKHVFVRDIREANIVKQFNFETILVLYEIPESYDKQLIISVNSLDHLKQIPFNSKVELKIDTGMNRNGIKSDEIDLAMEIIKKNNLNIFGVFTHFCCADEVNNITKEQENIFLKLVEYIKPKINNTFRVHCANSAGIHKVDMSNYDLARIGIGAYGYLDLEESKYLKPVLSLHAYKISTKKIKMGEHVGYGSFPFVADKNMVVSNYDIGYGNGFLRLSEKKSSKIQDGRAILGRVSMDSFSIEGDDDQICVFDDVNRLANVHDTINYEILTTLSPFIERKIKC